MLCVRSASFTRMTRMSRAIATIILRKFSACFSSAVTLALAENCESLVTPSTSCATSAPKSSVSSSGVARCLDGVVEQAGDDGRFVQLELGEDPSHFERMDQVRFAGLADLALMDLGAIDVRLLDEVEVGVRVILRHPIENVVQSKHPGPRHGLEEVDPPSRSPIQPLGCAQSVPRSAIPSLDSMTLATDSEC